MLYDDDSTASSVEDPIHISDEDRPSHKSRRYSQEYQSRLRPPPRKGSRRSSLGGTTVYATSSMAKLDTFLRSSGLRLKPDGTCQFLFETTRFVLETTDDEEEDGEFLLYCSLGELKFLRENFGGSQRKLLKMLSMWNEELRMEGGDDTGLLRIDSSKEGGPHVSFIYYGQVKDMETAEDFQALLDEFVDDGLDFFERLNGGLLDDDDEEEEYVAPVQRNSHVGSTKSLKSHSTAATVNTLSSDESAGQGNHGAKGGSFHRAAPPTSTSISQTLEQFGSSSTSLNTSQEKGKKSVFSKVISTLQKKNDPTVAMAFIDPSNPTSAFVVDKTVANATEKPKIIISRKGSEKKGASFHVDGRDNTRHPQRNTKSFHDERSGRIAKRSSLPDVQEDGQRGSIISKRSSQPSIGEDSCGRKSTSFYDYKRPSMSDESGRKTKSFHTYKNKRSSIDLESHPHIEHRTSHGASFNRSVDIFNDSGACEVRTHKGIKTHSSNFNYSEPVLPSHHKAEKTNRPKQVKTHSDKYRQQLDSSHRSAHSISSGHRRKTLNDVERPKQVVKHRRDAYAMEDKAMRAYYERHNAYPPPPPPRGGSKWFMDNDSHSNYESDEYSMEDEGLYD